MIFLLYFSIFWMITWRFGNGPTIDMQLPSPKTDGITLSSFFKASPAISVLCVQFFQSFPSDFSTVPELSIEQQRSRPITNISAQLPPCIMSVQYTGGHHWIHRGMFSTPGFPYKFNCFLNDLPHNNHDILPVYSWYSPGVLKITELQSSSVDL